MSKSVGKASPQERPAILASAKELAEQVKAAESASSAAAAELDALARQFANLIEGAPSGGEEDYVVLRHEGPAPRDFAAEGFAPADSPGRSARAWTSSTPAAAPRSPGPASTSSRAPACAWSSP